MPEPAAGELDAAFEVCRRIAAEHGRTYYLATRVLPADRRRAVHALYGFARLVDDVVDMSDPVRPGNRAEQLDEIEAELRAVLASGPAALPEDPDRRPVLLALHATMATYQIAPQPFWDFMRSMRMDVPGTAEYRRDYADMAQLQTYMDGSAAAIGLQLLPVLGTVVPVERARRPAAALGDAFQLTNFIRDVGEDLDRGRLYLPLDELAAFGVDRAMLEDARATGAVDPRIRRALAHLIAVNRSIYRQAEPGLAMLSPRVRPGIRVAFELYAGILDEVERADFRIFDRRVRVSRRRRAAVAARELLRRR